MKESRSSAARRMTTIFVGAFTQNGRFVCEVSFGVGGGEAGEVVGAEQVEGGGFEGFEVEWPAAVPDEGGEEGVADALGGGGFYAAFEDAVLVCFGAGGVAGVEGVGDAVGGEDADAGGEGAVECAEQVGGRDVGGEGEAGNLAEGVDAGVGAAGALGEDVLVEDGAQGGGESSLDGREAGLDLPAVEAGAVVGQLELPVGHGFDSSMGAARLR